ncbi:MAG: hypothetical protein HY875_14190 [Chloroflexi bacterium]|nr:hypothetical protein [Chloroflexota bacterium]
MATASSGASEYQRAILKDGVLTFGEYERSIFDEIACLKAAGFEVGGVPLPGRPKPGPDPALTRRGEYQYVSRALALTESEAEARRTHCSESFTSVIRNLWFEHVAPTQADLQAARDAIGACLRGAGFTVSVHPGTQELLAIAFPPDGKPTNPAIEPYTTCTQSVQIEFELPGFRG